ncbi:P-loop NTPase family protein [Methylacidiphilum caldifontis]|uniref:Uncharacterized protein n=1 Tax=Methylacidiphilum caldifontis TaxID=2795386 RepID=A0A4Y8PF55_9BACT|nr:ATP-binding protein [Methylacidiphilum caldifontis]TFE70586.1 hypothetical protein A7Q10_05775 [Methylacidiphilum caldifontis]
MIGFSNKKEESALNWNIFFGSHVVDHRKIAPSVEGLGQKPFSQIVPLLSSQIKGGEKKIFVLYSFCSGSGKSHLIGRLFHYFSQNLFLVSIPPLFDCRGFFQHLQQCLFYELLFPEKPGATGCWPGQASQLDALAYGLLLELVSRAAQKNKNLYRKIRSALAFLKKNPTSLLPEEVVPEWVEWIKRDFHFVLPFLEKELVSWGTLEDDPRDWIKIIYGFSILGQDRRIKEICKNWFLGEPFISPEPSFFDIPYKPFHGDRETFAKSKIRDFFVLSSRIRPFLLVFDHWENALLDKSYFDSWSKNIGELFGFPGTLIIIAGSNKLWDSLKADPLISTYLHPLYVEEPKKEHLIELGIGRLNRIKKLSKEKKAEAIKLINNYDGPLSYSFFLKYGYESILPLLKDPNFTALGYFEEVMLEVKLALELNPALLTFRCPITWFLTHAARSVCWINGVKTEESFFRIRWQVGLRQFSFSFEIPSLHSEKESSFKENQRSTEKAINQEEYFFYILPPENHPSFPQLKNLDRESLKNIIYIDFEKYIEIASLYLLFITAYPNLLQKPEIKVRTESLAQFFITQHQFIGQFSKTTELPQTYYEIVRDTVKDKKSVGYFSLCESLPVKLSRKDILRAAGFSPEILVVPSLSGEPHFLWIP